MNSRKGPPGRLLMRRLHPTLAAVFLLLAGVALSYRYSMLQIRNESNQMHNRVISELDKVRGELSRELFASINLTQGLVSLVRIQGGIDQRQFEALARELISHAHHIRNIALAPDNELYHYALGNVLLHDGRLLGAVTTLKRAIELDPNDAHAHHALGIAFARSGDLAGARAELAILEKLEPASAERLRQELPPA